MSEYDDVFLGGLQWRRTYFRQWPSLEKDPPKLPKNYFEICGAALEYEPVKSMKKLQNIWNKHHDPQKDFTDSISVPKVGFGQSRFVLTWSNGREFTNLFCILKSYNKGGKNSWYYKKIQKGKLWIADFKYANSINWDEFDNGKYKNA